MTERCNERFFEMSFAGYCGVFIREDAAKKLQKILWRQTQEIKDFLTRNIDALEAVNWTLAYTPKQTTVKYYDGCSRENLKERIDLIDKTDRIKFVPDVFRTDQTYAEARQEVQVFYEEHYGEEGGGENVGERGIPFES